jgi:hypothetical protein
MNELPQGKSCGIDKYFCCLIDVTCSVLPKYTDYSQYQDIVEFSYKLSVYSRGKPRGIKPYRLRLIKISDNFTNEWVNGFIECNNIKLEYTETLKIMLKNTMGNKIYNRQENK